MEHRMVYQNTSYRLWWNFTSNIRRGFTYFDYEGDGDMDVFACDFENEIEEHLEYQIIVNKGTIGRYNGKYIIINQLPYYATLLSPIDIEREIWILLCL